MRVAGIAVLAFTLAFGFAITWAAIKIAQAVGEEPCLTDTDCGL